MNYSYHSLLSIEQIPIKNSFNRSHRKRFDHYIYIPSSIKLMMIPSGFNTSDQSKMTISGMFVTISVTFGSLMTVVCGTIAISIADPQLNFINILFEVVSAFATVGLSTGITAGLTSFIKLVLISTMYIGRVGILLLISALLGDPRLSAVRYPEESLLVG